MHDALTTAFPAASIKVRNFFSRKRVIKGQHGNFVCYGFKTVQRLAPDPLSRRMGGIKLREFALEGFQLTHQLVKARI